VLYLDLDRFKAVNDSLGHKAGDRLLVEVAARLRELVRDAETIARMGGDEFVVVMNAEHAHASATALAQRMVEAIGQPYQIGVHKLHIGLSVGVALFPHDGSDADELLRKADLALYRAKAEGRNTMRTFDPAADAPLPAH
jgi:diguanylate cyclase (GGDEF)-like protein